MSSSPTTQRPYPLDESVAVGLRSGRVWGLGEVGLAILGSLAAYVVAGLLTTAAGLSVEVGTALAYLALGGVMVLCCRPAVEAAGSWLAGIGWRLPRLGDIPTIALWSALVYAVRFVTGAVLVHLIPSLQDQELSNVDASSHSAATIVVLFVVTVAAAPAVEELFFRGLVLRAGMRRLGFWPAMIGSSLLFGFAHSYQLGTVTGGIYLGLVMFTFGFLQCLLVRRTGHIGQSIGVHATTNAITMIIALATGVI
ncbi:MAG TPA: type II CAAX endopeptidase family protein [Mycobacteriales bacterium]|nr:type II CAAX endopeptidase family protein [Mycobacteriales bacterium]